MLVAPRHCLSFRVAIQTCVALSLSVTLATESPAGGRPDLLWLAGGHSQDVNALSFSADGALLVSASHDRTVKVWDYAGARLLHTITLPFVYTAQVVQIPVARASPNGQLVAAAIRLSDTHSYFANVRLFDAQSGAQQHIFPQTAIAARGLAFSPDGALLAEGGDAVRIWNVATLESVITLPVAGETTALEFSPDGSRLAGGFSNGRLRLWRTSDWMLERSWIGHSGQARAVTFAPNGTQLASTGDDGAVTLWAVPAAEFIRTMIHSGGASTLAFSPEGASLASGGSDHMINLWNPDTSGLLRTLVGHDGPVLTIVFAPDGGTLVSGGQYPDFTIHRWNPADGQPVAPLTAHAAPVRQTLFTRDGQQLLTAGTFDQTLRRWDAVTGVPQGVGTFPMTAIWDVALSPDGQLEAVPADGNWSVVIRRTSDGGIEQTLSGLFAPVAAVEFSPDGFLLAVGFDYPGGTVQFFSVPGFAPIQELGEGEGPMDGLVFSPDSTLLAASNGGGLNVFRIEDGATLPTPNLWATNCAFSPDGTLLVVGSIYDPQTHVLRVSDWSTVTTLDAVSADVDFSPDGLYLLSGEAARLKFWRVADWSLQDVYDSELGFGSIFEGVQSVRFSPDGCLFAYGRSDATVAVARSPVAILTGDTNGDLRVDLLDLAVLLANFGTPQGATVAEGDVDGDGDVDLADLTILLASFGRTCP